MGNHFVLNGKQYIVSVMTEDNFTKFTMKVRKTKKVIGDKEYIFIKNYKYEELSVQITNSFKSIKQFHQYLSSHQDDMSIVQKNLKIKLKNNEEVLINFENKNEASMFVVGETNELVQKRNQLGNTLGFLGNILTNNNQKDNQLVFAKLYSFYEKLCHKNQNKKINQNMRLELVQLVDLIVEEYDIYESQLMGGANMKKKKSSALQQSQNQQIQVLKEQLQRQKTIIQTLNDTIQARIQVSIQKMIKWNNKQIEEMKNPQKTKIQQAFLNQIQSLVNAKRSEINGNITKNVPIGRFLNKNDLTSFIQDLLKQKKNLQILLKKANVKVQELNSYIREDPLQIFVNSSNSQSSKGLKIRQFGQKTPQLQKKSQVFAKKSSQQPQVSSISSRSSGLN